MYQGWSVKELLLHIGLIPQVIPQLLENTCVTPTIRGTTIFTNHHGKMKSLIYKMLFIPEKKLKLNTQSGSIKAKLLSTYT